jgi:hypothetical protein
MEVLFTVDERITDGFYFTKSIKLFQDLLIHPEALLSRPEVPPKPMSKREYKRARKASAQTTPKSDR